MILRYDNLAQACRDEEISLIADGQPVDAGHWQGVPTEGRPDLQTRELLNVVWQAPLPGPGMGAENALLRESLRDLQEQIKPNLPWADDHFLERVSRVPSNPGEQYKNWPWWRGQARYTMETDPGAPAGQFTHTYQERFWPKWYSSEQVDEGRQARQGIRYHYGDLDDVVQLLLRQPYTRQAYLPIFFPEDTGAVHGGRIPCTLGYWFVLREGKLSMTYTIRSCDLVRHFRDDVYLSCRLLLWVLKELQDTSNPLWVDVVPGDLTFHAFSLHFHEGDRHHLQGG